MDVIRDGEEDFIGLWQRELQKVLNRTGLSLRLRLLTFISALVSLGEKRLLSEIFRQALESGITEVEIREAVLQTYLHAGYPAAIEGLVALNEVIRPEEGERVLKENISATSVPPDQWQARGMEVCRKVYGRNFPKLIENMRALSPDLAEWMIAEGYGKVLSRPILAPEERELCSVATLTVLKWERQLHSHIKGAINMGATKDEVREVILQMRLVVGYPAVIIGLGLLDKS